MLLRLGGPGGGGGGLCEFDAAKLTVDTLRVVGGGGGGGELLFNVAFDLGSVFSYIGCTKIWLQAS